VVRVTGTDLQRIVILSGSTASSREGLRDATPCGLVRRSTSTCSRAVLDWDGVVSADPASQVASNRAFLFATRNAAPVGSPSLVQNQAPATAPSIVEFKAIEVGMSPTVRVSQGGVTCEKGYANWRTWTVVFSP
jgi:hypothetical protein